MKYYFQNQSKKIFGRTAAGRIPLTKECMRAQIQIFLPFVKGVRVFSIMSQ